MKQTKEEKKAEASKKKIDNAVKVLMRELGHDAIVIFSSTLAPEDGSDKLPLSDVKTISVFGSPDTPSEEWSVVPFGSQMGMVSVGRMALENTQLAHQEQRRIDAQLINLPITEEIRAYCVAQNMPQSEEMEVGHSLRVAPDVAQGIEAAAKAFASQPQED